MEVVDDLRNGNSFPHYLNKFYLLGMANQALNDEAKKKMYISLNFMENVIRTLVSFCPSLKASKVKGSSKKKRDQKQQLVKDFMELNDWDVVNDEIYDVLESKGDAYFYIYFMEGDTIPRIKLLRSQYLLNMTVDSFERPKAYVYREPIWDEEVNIITGNIEEINHRYATWVFEKGKTSRSILAETDDGQVVKDENGEVKIEEEEWMNKDFYADQFSIIHIPSYKKQYERFSIIPADDYIDLCLQLDQITTDMRTTNRQFSYPIQTILDGKFCKGDGEIGGIRYAETSEDAMLSDKQAKIFDFQLKNSLESSFAEFNMVRDNLYQMAGLPSPTMIQEVGKSDSSKVFQQINMRTEQKIEKYVNNIRKAFIPIFKILFEANGLYEEKYDLGYTLEMPEDLIKKSSYDKKLQLQLDLLNGQTSMREALRRRGLDEKEIDDLMNEINEEKNNGADDVSSVKDEVKMEVNNANNVS